MNTKKRFGVSVILLMLVLAVSAYAATLPSQGGSNNVWGTELNTWLQVAHDSTGAIQSNYVTSAMINDQTIAAGDIAPGAVNITHFGAITQINGTHITDEIITTGKLANQTVGLNDMAPGSINITHFGAITTINGTHMADDGITTSDIANQTVGLNDIAPGSINITHFGAITTINSTHLTTASVASDELAVNSVNTSHIIDQTIVANDMAPGSINITHFGAITQINGTHITNNVTLNGLNVSGNVMRNIVSGVSTCGIAQTFNNTLGGLVTLPSTPEVISCSALGDAANVTTVCSVRVVNTTGFTSECKTFGVTGGAGQNATAVITYVAIDL